VISLFEAFAFKLNLFSYTEDVVGAAESFASHIRNLVDYELITAGGGDNTYMLIEPLAYYAVCLEVAVSLDKILMRKQLKIDAHRMLEERDADVNPLALPTMMKVARTMTATQKSRPPAHEDSASAKPGTGGGRFFGWFGGKKVVPTPPTLATLVGVSSALSAKLAVAPTSTSQRWGYCTS
jgi:hypothetical protein